MISNDKNPMQGYNAKDRNFQKTDADDNKVGGNAGDTENEENKGVESSEEEAVEDEADPVLDETDLEENHLSDEEADKIEWEPSQPQAEQRDQQGQ